MGPPMILPDFVLPSRINQAWSDSGIDSLEYCKDKKHFKSYPHDITYNYNSRGFRDAEWPQQLDELQSAIWCVGDSFTVGIGSPLEHTWPSVLSRASKIRTINVSMDGASNMWIARRAVKILTTINPKTLIIHWSYLHRREGLTQLNSYRQKCFLMHYENVKDPSWPSLTAIDQFNSLPVQIQNKLLSDASWRNNLSDEDLKLWHDHSEINVDISNTIDCINLVDQHSASARIVHSFIPEFMPLQEEFYQQIVTPHRVIPEFPRLDLARDKHHYDIKTSQYFVQKILQELNQ
jgi:hypothetical protein